MSKNAYYLEEHTFFDDLVTMIMSLSSYMFTLHVTIESNNPVEFDKRGLREWLNYIAPVKNPEHPLSLIRNFDNSEVIFFPFDIINHISLNSWPKLIEYNVVAEMDSHSKKYSINSNINKKIVVKIVGSSFINYYESQIDLIKTKFGDDRQNWPELLNFARHIRNGFAHNGKFNFTNINTPTVRWGIWELDYRHNNDDVLFSSKGLNVGDVILLMEMIDPLLRP